MAERKQPAIVARDLPGLFQSADTASTRAQRLYLRLVAADLCVMLIGATLGAMSFRETRAAESLALASAVSIAAGLMLSYTLQAQKLSRTWYGGRALAEAAKTSAWLYMMRAHPFEDPSDENAERALLSTFDSFVHDHSSGVVMPSGQPPQHPQVTPAMRSTRSLPAAERRVVYLESRLGEQRAWYAARAAANARNARHFFILVIACHGLALIAAIARVRWPEGSVNFTGVFVALAAAFIAWTQLRRYEEQAHVYAMTAYELTALEEQAELARKDEDLERFVEQAENTISRENALWIARRREA